MFCGTIDGASVFPHEIVKEELQFNAVEVISSRNHPSDDPKPSGADKVLSLLLEEALGVIGRAWPALTSRASAHFFCCAQRSYLVPLRSRWRRRFMYASSTRSSGLRPKALFANEASVRSVSLKPLGSWP